MRAVRPKRKAESGGWPGGGVRDWSTADRLRKDLAAQEITPRDGPAVRNGRLNEGYGQSTAAALQSRFYRRLKRVVDLNREVA